MGACICGGGKVNVPYSWSSVISHQLCMDGGVSMYGREAASNVDELRGAGMIEVAGIGCPRFVFGNAAQVNDPWTVYEHDRSLAAAMVSGPITSLSTNVCARYMSAV